MYTMYMIYYNSLSCKQPYITQAYIVDVKNESHPVFNVQVCCSHTHLYTYMYTYMYIHVYMYAHVMYVCTVYMLMYMYMYIHEKHCHGGARQASNPALTGQ